MDGVTQMELNAELNAVEERVDRRHAEILGKIELLFQQNAEGKSKISELVSQIKSVREDNAKDNKSTRTAVYFIVLTSFFAAVALMLTSNANIIAAFRTAIGTMK